jgi:hypothetical protein
MKIFIVLAALFVSGTIGQVDWCYYKADGSYCYNSYVVYCSFGRTTSSVACTYCSQTGLTTASCTSYQVPTSYCQSKLNGYSCYQPFGSSIYTSVRCDNGVVVQQQTCSGQCDFVSGFCSGSGGTTSTCSPSCQYGCTLSGTCKLPTFCQKTQTVSPSSAAFCGAIVGSRSIDYQLSVYSQDKDAKSYNDFLSAYLNVSYPSTCLTTITKFTCEDKFLNCNEKGITYQTCRAMCDDAFTCMSNALTSAGITSPAPINCKVECSSANQIVAQLAMILFVLMTMLLFY